MRLWVLATLFLAILQAPLARVEAHEDFDPTGFWSGAIIRDSLVLPVEVEIVETPEGYRATTLFPDWYFYRPENPEIVRKTANGLIIEDLLSGDAILELEPRFEQLTGTIGDDGRRIHLKRSPPPPRALVSSSETEFVSADGTRISATLTMPEFGERVAGMVMVRGRGCASRLNGRARLFAQYGIAVLTYDKRGAGQSEGDCSTFTFEQLTDDAIAAHRHLASNPRVDAEKVGFFGESAGAWTIQAATEKQRADSAAPQAAFLVTWIGPSTSIIQQQVSSAYTYGQSVGLDADQQEILAEVSRIIVDQSLSDDTAFARLERIRRDAEAEGWVDRGFGSDDIPKTRSDMPRLWLRRFSYDPAPFLASLGDLPYLAVFGARDPIVPLTENVEALRDKGDDVTISVLAESGHGYDFDERIVELSDGTEVLLFEGPDTGFATETIEFLRERGFMTR